MNTIPPAGPERSSSKAGGSILRACWLRYGAAVGIVALASALREAFTPVWGPTAVPFIFFFPAVVLAAWYGRLGPGIAAAVLSTLVADWYFIEPRHNLLAKDPTYIVGLLVFAGGAFCIVAAIEAMHRANDRAQDEIEKRKLLNAELERRVAERTGQIEEKASRLRETIRELEAFTYTVAHDLRTPLRAMHGLADLILEDAGERLGAPEREHLKGITRAAEHMDALVRDLLAYSRLSRAEMAAEATDLASLVAEVLRQMEAEFSRLEAEVVVEGGLPQVLGHRVTLFQVLMNLLANAAKFVAPGVKPRIRIAAQTRSGWVRLIVEDNGIGIAPEHHERVFQVFQRLHRTEAYPGTGIGLAIVRRAVERMGGRVGVESQEGKGSRFWFELPGVSSTADAEPSLRSVSSGRTPEGG